LFKHKFSELSLIQVAEYIASKQGSVDKASLDISHLASSVDWRGTGVLPPIRNQGECGSCYALAACYAIECLLLLVMGLKVRLSPQELLDCDGQGGCCGGSFFQAFEYIIANGISLECDYPYCAEKLSCRADKSKKRYYITDYHHIPFRAYSEALLMEAVCKQPVVVSVAVGEDFDTYKTGVYDSYDRFQEVSHSMLLVGYGMFEGEKVWIVQNSYGEGWGYDGFGYIKRSNGTLAGSCGILVHAGYPIIKVLTFPLV
jgi:C1A family cysteine protease